MPQLIIFVLEAAGPYLLRHDMWMQPADEGMDLCAEVPPSFIQKRGEVMHDSF